MSTENLKNGQENLDDELMMAMMAPTIDMDSDNAIAISAEDEREGSLDFSKHFWSPQPGNSYTIKFLPLVEPEYPKPFVNREVYKKLPDPKRKGKTFHAISSGKASTSPALQLFFDLNNLKKGGDHLADAKIKSFLGKTSEQCAKIQVLNSPIKEEIGIIRLFSYSNSGQNATVMNLIAQKLNPTKAQIENGIVREDIFNAFGSVPMMIECQIATFEDPVTGEKSKGRDFSKSSWGLKQRGAVVKLEDGTSHEFSASDLDENGKLKPEFLPYFKQLYKELRNPDVSVRDWFAFKSSTDAGLPDEVRDYVKLVEDKVNEIIPIIRDNDIAFIKNYGIAEAAGSNSSGSVPADKKSKDIYSDSIPEELQGTIGDATAQKQSEAPEQKLAGETTSSATDSGNPLDVLG